MGKHEHESEHRCMVCGRLLKSPLSIRYKMGAKCRARVIGIAREEGLIHLENRRVSRYGTKQLRLFSKGGNKDESNN